METKTRLYLDMDGVVCYFDKAACHRWGFQPDGSGWYDIEDHHWKMIEEEPEFWSKMEWQPGGKLLWEATKDMNTWILSAYNQAVMKPTIMGKIDWITLEMPELPVWKAKLVMREDKHHFARNLNGTRNILIDDNRKNTQEWFQAGGVAIYHKDVTFTLSCIADIKAGRIDLNNPAHLEYISL